MHLLVVLISLLCMVNCSFELFSIYVVPSFIETTKQDGTLQNPFSTIAQARDYFRQNSSSSWRRIALYPTYHFLENHSLIFDQQDSQSIYTKMTNNERNQIPLIRRKNLTELDIPIISGGIRLTNWTNNQGV